MMRQERILLVDDEPKLLSSFKRHFRREYDVHLAENADEALQAIERDGPFAVVVSDHQMPGMSGVELFHRMRDLGDQSVRIMLTGSMDQAVAVAAVNDGGVFRFHNKGDGLATLKQSVAEGVAHFKSMAEYEGPLTASSSAPKGSGLREDIAAALDAQQFHLLYQPQLEPLRGSIVGAEALLRWKHPSLGHVSPEVFVPVLEETGEVARVGGWIMEQACVGLADFRRHGCDVPRIAVNLSPHQLLQDDLVETVEIALQRSKLDARSLELELTESAAIEFGAEMQSRLNALKELGIQLAIDDFGTGYSTFSNLTQLPLDRLKIDKSLVQDVDQNDQRRAVIATIVNMCRELDLSVTIEGVERQTQLDAVRDLGCDEVQGFFFSPPLAPEKLESFVRDGGGCGLVKE